MSLIKSLANQTAIYGLGHILPRILHFTVFNTYLTYRVSRGDYAIYLDLYAYASILLVLFSYRMDTAMFRFGKTKLDLPKVYGTALLPMFISSAALVCLGYLYAEEISQLLTYPGRGYYVKFFCWIIAFDVLSLLPYAKYRLESKPLSFVGFKVANILITVILVLWLMESVGLEGVKNYLPFIQGEIDLVFMANLAASAILFVILLIRNLPSRIYIDWKMWKRMVYYALPLVIVGIAASVNQFFAVPLQKYFLGAVIEINKEQSAVYGAAQKIASLLAMFTTAYNYAAEPFFFRHSDEKGSRQLYGEIALFFVITAGALCLGIYLYLDLFQFIVGPHFRDALYLIPILLLAYLFLGIYYNVSIWYKLSDHTMYGAGIASVGAIITLIGSIALLPVMGIAASAWTALCCYAIMVVLAYWFGQRIYPIFYPVKRIVLHIVIIVAILGLSFLTKSTSILYNIILGTIFFITYIGIVYLLEKRKILDLIGPK